MSAKPTVASLAARADEQDAKLDAILAAIAGQGNTSDDKPTTKAKARTTKAKAAKLVRNLDPVTIDCDGVELTIASQSNGGQLYRKGSRLMCNTGRSFTADEVLAIVANGDVILAAFEQVDEAAKIGDHLPADESAKATA